MDDLYDMVKANAALRKQKAAEYGVGFEASGVNSTECTEKAREKAKRESCVMCLGR
jgi:predicted secreted protein